jgi:tRNA threonylcarbamoyl adenosine modification protein YjeE
MQRTFLTQPDLERFASDLATQLRPGDVVGLSGPLGSGKTTVVRAIVRALHGDDPTTSPTFTFWHRYAGNPPIDHLDLYRVEDRRDLTELGLEQAFDGTSIVLVEWWDHAPELLPPRRFEIDVQGAGSEPRRLTVSEPR